MYYTRIW